MLATRAMSHRARIRTCLGALVATGVVLGLGGCQAGSVGTEPISRCVPEGACGEAMFQAGLKRGEPNLERGQELYNASCASCHGLGGRGVGPTAAIDMTQATWHAKLEDKEIAEAIQRGRPPTMPPIPLGETQLRDVIGYVRTLKAQR